jgi:hypothetical protein
MWALNGSASVAGSALAVSIAMSFGYTWVQLFGAASYLLATVAMRGLHRKKDETNAA